MKLALLVCLLLPACVEATWSSRSYLSHDQSSGATNRDVTTTAREVVRLFEVREFQLLDQQAMRATDGGLVMKLAKSNRPLPANKTVSPGVGAHDVGSVFYVWITPDGADGSRVELLGKPTLAGAEPCTTEGVKPCTTVTASAQFVAAFMSGRDEAQIVHGILSELQLEGYVVSR
jgi:hypothetical protein